MENEAEEPEVEVESEKTETEPVVETESKIEQSCENIHVDVKETKTIMPVVLRTQILVIVAIIIGVIGCILNFV